MKKAILVLVVVSLGLFLTAGGAFAATATQQLTVNAAVSSTAQLEFSATTINFPDQNPDSVPSIPSSPASITVTAKGKTSAGSDITLTCQAGDDLKSGGNTIDISNVTWTASGTGFVSGTMSKSAAQSVGTWSNSGNRSGTLSFFLANSWSYATGAYSATVTYTLTAP